MASVRHLGIYDERIAGDGATSRRWWAIPRPSADAAAATRRRSAGHPCARDRPLPNDGRLCGPGCGKQEHAVVNLLFDGLRWSHPPHRCAGPTPAGSAALPPLSGGHPTNRTGDLCSVAGLLPVGAGGAWTGGRLQHRQIQRRQLPLVVSGHKPCAWPVRSSTVPAPPQTKRPRCVPLAFVQARSAPMLQA